MLPLLIGLREMRLKELEDERAFVKLMAETHHIDEKKLWKLVDWWKKKVICHRPLASDDKKAWRMILGKAKA